MTAPADPAPVPVPAPVPAAAVPAPEAGPLGGYASRFVIPREGALGLHVRAILVAVRRHLWLALAIVGAVVALAVVVTMLQTPRFTASSSVQINDQTEEVLGAQFESTTAPQQPDWNTDRFLNTQLDILRSRALAERVADALDLPRSDRFFAAMQVADAARAKDAARRREQVVQLLRANFDVTLPRETRIASLEFTSTDAGLSAQIADAFAAEFIQSNLQRRFDASAYARNFVAEQLDEARADLERSEQDLNQYAKSVGLIRTRDTFAPDNRDTAAGTVTSSSLLTYNDAAINARAARIAAEAKWEAIRAAPLLSSEPVLANPTVIGLMSRRAELEGQLATARERYLPDHPTVQRLQDDLRATTAQLTRTASTVRDSARAAYVAALQAERALTGEVQAARSRTLTEQDQSVRYNTLAREADTARSIYDGLLQRFRELNASAGIATSNIAIIDKAEVPRQPSSPNLLRNLLLGLIAGLLLAALAVFLRDQLDDVVHTPEDVEDKLGLPLLGVVPRTDADDPLAELDVPKSPVSEAYFSLRGALLYSTPNGLPKVIVVTSAQANEGKTTTSYAIAEALARIGRKPLLIDADLRRPSLHRRAGVDGARGLTDLLVSRDDPFGPIIDVPGRGFDLLAAGPPPPSPSELLAAPRMAQLIESYSAKYDAIIIDSPPVLGLADAPMLAALADGTVFVIEADRGRAGALKTALRRLRAVEPVLLGGLFIKFDPTLSGNQYSAYFGYDYYESNTGETK